MHSQGKAETPALAQVNQSFELTRHNVTGAELVEHTVAVVGKGKEWHVKTGHHLISKTKQQEAQCASPGWDDHTCSSRVT